MARFKLTRTRHPGVFRRDTDHRYVVRIKAVWPKTGQSREKTLILAEDATLSQAVSAAERLRQELRQGHDPVNKVPTVRDYSERWVARKAARGDWREGSTTRVIVAGVLANHILPTLGDYLIDRVTVADLQDWMDRQVKSGGKPSTIGLRWNILAPLIRDACVEYRAPDPTPPVRPPKRGTRKGGKDMVLLPAEVLRFVQDVTEHEPQWLTLVLLGFSTGARVCELIPAKVGDFDFSEDIGVWTISRHLGYGNAIVPGTKTGQESRPAYLSPDTTAQIRERVKGRFAGEFVQPGRAKSGCYDRSSLSSMIERAAKRLKMSDLSGKLFRQTHATLCRIAGISDFITQAQLGHTSAAMTDVYTRIPDAPRRDAARQMGTVVPLRLTDPKDN